MSTAKTTAAKTAPRKPQDRKPKADQPYKVTVDGKTWIIDKAATDDFELLDDLNAADSGESHKMPSLLRRLFGDAQYAKAMDHLRDPKTGRVTVTAASAFITAVFKALDEGNS